MQPAVNEILFGLIGIISLVVAVVALFVAIAARNSGRNTRRRVAKMTKSGSKRGKRGEPAEPRAAQSKPPATAISQDARPSGDTADKPAKGWWDQGAWQIAEVVDQRLLRNARAIPLPNVTLRQSSGVPDLGLFLSIGEAWCQVASHFLPPNPVILDVGCGCGKMARFLMLHPTARYVGIDVLRPAIDWSNEAFGPVCGHRFDFRHIDVYSKLYNRKGRMSATDVVLPVEDESANFVICGSLFTHLLEDEMEHYLAELVRCVQPGGRIMASIHNQPKDGLRFSGTVDRIDIAETYWIEVCARHGLELYERVGDVYGQQVYVLARK